MTPCGSWPGHLRPPRRRCGNVMDAGWTHGCHLASCYLHPPSPFPLPSSSFGTWRAHTCGSFSCRGCGNLRKQIIPENKKISYLRSKIRGSLDFFPFPFEGFGLTLETWCVPCVSISPREPPKGINKVICLSVCVPLIAKTMVLTVLDQTEFENQHFDDYVDYVKH